MMFRQDDHPAAEVAPATNSSMQTTRQHQQKCSTAAGQQQEQEETAAVTSPSQPTIIVSSPSSANNNTTTTSKRFSRRKSADALSPQVLESLDPYDVLCGRCAKCYNNIGNRRFRLTVTINTPAYTIAKSKQDKRIIVQSILQSIKDAGGRFLRPNTVDVLVVMDDVKAREKIGHALRDLLNMTQAREREERAMPSWVNHFSSTTSTTDRRSSSSSVERIPEVMASGGDYDQAARATNEDSSGNHSIAPQNQQDTASTTSLLVQHRYNQVASTPSILVIGSGPTPFLPASNVGSGNDDNYGTTPNTVPHHLINFGGTSDICLSKNTGRSSSHKNNDNIDDVFMLYIDQMIHSCSYDDGDEDPSEPYPLKKKEEGRPAVLLHQEEATTAATQNDRAEEGHSSCF